VPLEPASRAVWSLVGSVFRIGGLRKRLKLPAELAHP
jgi:hypothetical protein